MGGRSWLDSGFPNRKTDLRTKILPTAEVSKGLEGVVANESGLSNVQGADGKLSYLGYTIDELVEHTTFEEVMYLLHRGKLPNRTELDEFVKVLRAQRELPQGVRFSQRCA